LPHSVPLAGNICGRNGGKKMQDVQQGKRALREPDTIFLLELIETGRWDGVNGGRERKGFGARQEASEKSGGKKWKGRSP